MINTKSNGDTNTLRLHATLKWHIDIIITIHLNLMDGKEEEEAKPRTPSLRNSRATCCTVTGRNADLRVAQSLVPPVLTHYDSLTWKWKMGPWKTTILYKQAGFHFHVI